MNKFVLIILTFLISKSGLYSQSVIGVNFLIHNSLYKEYTSDNYDRLGLTIFSNQAQYHNSTYSKSVSQFFKRPFQSNLISKFDYTNSQIKIDDISVPRKSAERNGLSKSDYLGSLIKTELVKNKVSNKIIQEFNKPWNNSNSAYAPKEVMNRFYLNVTNNDINRVKSLRHNVNDMSFIDSLYNVYKNNYIVVHSFKKIVKMSEIYAKRRYASNMLFSIVTLGLIKLEDIDPDRVDLINGWKVKGTTYLYKINVTNKQIDDILKNYRTGSTSEIINQIEFPIEMVKSVNFRLKSIVPNNRNYPENLEEIQSRMSSELHRATIGQLENKVDEFKIKRTIEYGYPLRIEVGSKEGIKLNQRFLVFENRFDAKSKLFKRPIGAVRIKKVVKNSKSLKDVSDFNELSEVYQFQGQKISEGAFVQQWDDYGIEFGYNYSIINGFNSGVHQINIDYDLSPKIGIANLKFHIGFNSNKGTSELTSLIESGIINNKGGLSNFYFLPKNDVEGQFKYSDIKVITQAKSLIWGISEIGLAYDYSFFQNFYAQFNGGFRGFNISFSDGATLGYGNSVKYSTLNQIDLYGLYTGIDLGFYISPSISLFSGITQSYYSVNYYGNYKNEEISSKAPYNRTLSYGLKIHL